MAAAQAQAVDEVIVVDNGSSDATAIAGGRVVARVAARRRLRCAAGSAAAHGDILVYLDGDGSSLPAEMPRLIEPLRAGAADLALGSRGAGAHRGRRDAAAPAFRQLAGREPDAGVVSCASHRPGSIPRHPPRPAGGAGHARDDVRLADRDDGEGGPPGARIHEVPVSYLARTWGRSKVGGNLRGSHACGLSDLERHAAVRALSGFAIAENRANPPPQTSARLHRYGLFDAPCRCDKLIM